MASEAMASSESAEMQQQSSSCHLQTPPPIQPSPPLAPPSPTLSCPHSRPLGGTEQNWCRAVAGGTGITVLAILFSRLLQPSRVQEAVDSVQRLHPRLRSKLAWLNGKPAFSVTPHPFVKLEVITNNALHTSSAPVSTEKCSKSFLQTNSEQNVNKDDSQKQISEVNSSEANAEFSLESGSKESSKAELCQKIGPPVNSNEAMAEMNLNIEDRKYQKPQFSVDLNQAIAESSLKIEFKERENHTQPAFALDSTEGKESLKEETHQKPTFAFDSSEAMADYNLKAKSKKIFEEENDKKSTCASDWLVHVEEELNTNIWGEEQHAMEAVQMFVARLYHLPHQRSALILRLHTAVCDRVSAATIISDILHTLHHTTLPPQNQNVVVQNVPNCEGGGEDSQPLNAPANSWCSEDCVEKLNAIEDVIPRGQGNKPFWAHGVDLLGYSLGSMRHALLPFKRLDLPRRSELIRSALSVEHTKALLQACKKENTSLFGALSAAGLKATTFIKRLGNQSEHFALISLVDCRQLLDPVLSASTVGFYHSAVLNTHFVNETTDFWSLARRCSNSLDNAMKNRKHFTDMGDVNFLMSQAIQHPNLTPSSSLRTSLLVFFRETSIDDSEKDLKELIGLEDYMGCSSIHGVGPGLSTFECLRKGSLQCTHVYPAPLHSRKQIQKLVNLMMDVLINSSKAQL